MTFLEALKVNETKKVRLILPGNCDWFNVGELRNRVDDQKGPLVAGCLGTWEAEPEKIVLEPRFAEVHEDIQNNRKIIFFARKDGEMIPFSDSIYHKLKGKKLKVTIEVIE
jgi:hypothetical protein